MISILQNILPNKTVFKIVNIHVCFLLLNPFSAQIKNSSFSSNYSLPFNKVSHSSIQPYLETIQYYTDTSIKKYRSNLGNKIFEYSLLDVTQNDIHITADPLFNLTLGPTNNDLDYRYYNNVRGFRITGDLSDNFS